MDKVRELIVKLSKKDSEIKKLTKDYSSSKINEEELLFQVINYLATELKEYRDADDFREHMTW